MDGIFGLLWFGIIIIGISSYFKKLKKQAEKAKKDQEIQRPAPAATRQVGQQLAMQFPELKPVSGSIPEGTDPCHESDLGGPDRMRSTLYGGSLGTYTGSLGITTNEGIDPCHEDQAMAMTSLEIGDLPDEDVATGLKFSWEGNEVLKAVVMQEILKRPCAR